MRLSESEKARPQDYFLQSGVDSEGNPIYSDTNQDISDYTPNKALRKRVFDGNADIVILADKIQTYWKGSLVAEAELEGQVETSPGVWQGQLFSFADANIKKITEDEYGRPVTPFYRAFEVKDIPALSITDAVFGMDVHWAFKDTKLSFYLDTPGFNCRVRWQCRVKDSAVAWTDDSDPDNPIYHKGLSFNVSDYKGVVNHGSQADPEPGWTIHWWTFEPDGHVCPALGESLSSESSVSSLSSLSESSRSQSSNSSESKQSKSSESSESSESSFSLSSSSSESSFSLSSSSSESKESKSYTSSESSDSESKSSKLSISESSESSSSSESKDSKSSSSKSVSSSSGSKPSQSSSSDESKSSQSSESTSDSSISESSESESSSSSSKSSDASPSSSSQSESSSSESSYSLAAEDTPKGRFLRGYGLVIDPYLRVDEQATYIDVYCDGYVVRFYTDDSTGDMYKVYQPSAIGTKIIDSEGPRFVSTDPYSYYLSVDPSAEYTIVENTPNRIVLRVKGNLYTDSVPGYLANSTSYEIYYYIFADKMFEYHTWVVAGTLSTMDYLFVAGMTLAGGTVTGETQCNEASGSEETGQSGYKNAADYMGFYSNEFTAITIKLYQSPWTISQQVGSYNARYRENTDPTADTYYFGCVTIFDSDEREGSALIYDSTDRLALGDQFKDLEIDLTEGGSRVFDDASSQYLRVDSVVFDESDAVTFGCWFKTDDLTADQALIGIGDKDNPFERLWIQVEGATAGDPIGVSMDGAGGADTTTGISSNTWHHACATSDGAASPALQILLDGGSKGTTSGTAHTVSGIDGLDIGRLRDSTSPFNYMSGKIAHAFVYNAFNRQRRRSHRRLCHDAL
jgi:hypothetical protein